MNSYNEARAAIDDRQALTENVLNSIETDLELLCLTGVEDKLQVLLHFFSTATLPANSPQSFVCAGGREAYSGDAP